VGLIFDIITTDINKIPWEEVRGLKIVMPKNMNPDFFAEAGQISRVMRMYGLLEVDIGSVREARKLKRRSVLIK
jgi:hypothetical protein